MTENNNEVLGDSEATKGVDAISMHDQSLVYYGPHPCQTCDADGKKGTMIVKAGNGAPDYLEFDFTHDSNYPNHIWKQHVHVA